MGNEFSGQTTGNDDKKEKPAYVEFLSSAGKTIGQASGVVCGSLNDTFEEVDATDRGKSSALLSSKRAKSDGFMNPEDDESLQANPMSQLFARALLTEVTDNPSTMTPMKMAEREKRLLRAQQRANSASKGMRAIGGQGTMKSQLQGASQRIIPPNLLSEHRAQVRGNGESSAPRGKHSVTIGLMLSRRDAEIGHPDTVTRQSGFNFNDLQDREYKYVSSTDASGWRAGGGEKGGPPIINDTVSHSLSDENDHDNHLPSSPKVPQSQKIPAPDMVHIPIIHIDCDSDAAVNAVIAALARGEVFIPHMSVTPEALGVNGISPPDLVVRFGCERNDDFPPEEWPNWCLEFMHNQLYEYFSDMGARWMKRPFQITLAKKVRWKTVKHMNKFFAHSETVINTWREKGPQYLNPQLAHIEGGATPEEVARPHGIYLLRNGKPTNYFAPNFEPPYTTKMTRSLVQNVLAKSWDKKRRDWSTSPIPIVTPGLLFSTMCGCAEPNQGGFIAREATEHFSPIGGGSTFFSENDLTLNTNAQHDRQLMQNIRIPREDSGITRSKIEIVDSRGKSPSLASSGNRDNSSVVSGRSSSVSRVTDSSADHSSDNYRYGQENIQSIFGNSLATESNQTEESGGDYSNESDEKIHAASNHSNYHDDTITSSPQQHMESPLKHGNQSINSKNDDFVEEDPQDYQLNNVVRNDEVSPRPQPVSHGAYSGEEKPTRSTSPQEGYGSQSVGESQTTAPIMNRSSTSFIEQERQRRKQREVEREKERKKIDELELAIQEKLRLHVEKRKKEVNPEAASVALEMPDADVEFKVRRKLLISIHVIITNGEVTDTCVFMYVCRRSTKRKRKQKRKRRNVTRRNAGNERGAAVDREHLHQMLRTIGTPFRNHVNLAKKTRRIGSSRLTQ